MHCYTHSCTGVILRELAESVPIGFYCQTILRILSILKQAEYDNVTKRLTLQNSSAVVRIDDGRLYKTCSNSCFSQMYELNPLRLHALIFRSYLSEAQLILL